MASLINKGSNVWKVVIYLGKDADGKKINHYETYYGTKSKATQYANELEIDLKKKHGSSKALAMNINQLFDKWLENADSIEISTLKQYENHAKKLRPIIGHLPLVTLTALQIKDNLRVLKDEGLSPRTIKNYYRSFKTAIYWGAENKLVSFEVSQDIAKNLKSPKVSRINREIFDQNRLEIFLDTAKNYKHYLPMRVLALSGMRVGELIGLKWANVMFENNIIRIIESMNSRYRYQKETKTHNSERDIELDPETIRLLREHKKVLSAMNLADKNDYVFQSSDGKPIRHQVLMRTKDRVLSKAGLNHIRIHDLRHGAGSLMLDNGASLTEVASYLGDTPETIAETYAHATKKGKTLVSILGLKEKSKEDALV